MPNNLYCLQHISMEFLGKKQQPGREILHCLYDFGLWNSPYLHSAACALKCYYACERGELRFFCVLVEKWKPVSYRQKEMIDLFWVSFSLTQKKIYFLKLWWNGCFTNRAFSPCNQNCTKRYTHYWCENWTRPKYKYNMVGLMQSLKGREHWS